MINRSKVYYFIVIIISLLLFTAGIIYFNTNIINSNLDYQSAIKEFIFQINNYHGNNCLISLSIISISFLLSFIIIGPIIFFIYNFYQFFSIGFIVSVIFSTYKIASLPFCFIYMLMYVVIPSILGWVIMLYLLKIIKYLLKRLIHHDSTLVSTKFNIYLKRSFIIYIIYIIYSLLIFSLGGYLLNLIAFFK